MRRLRSAAFLVMVITVVVARQQNILAEDFSYWQSLYSSACTEFNFWEEGDGFEASCRCYEDEWCLSIISSWCQGESETCDDYCNSVGEEYGVFGVFCSIYGDNAEFGCVCSYG